MVKLHKSVGAKNSIDATWSPDLPFVHIVDFLLTYPPFLFWVVIECPLTMVFTNSSAMTYLFTVDKGDIDERFLMARAAGNKSQLISEWNFGVFCHMNLIYLLDRLGFPEFGISDIIRNICLIFFFNSSNPVLTEFFFNKKSTFSVKSEQKNIT